MTRLKISDISTITINLNRYDQYLKSACGRSLLGIACHSLGVDNAQIGQRINSFRIYVIPVSAGLGIITDFSQTVCQILKFLGFDVNVTEATDTAGIAEAFEKGADGIMMADDNRFVGINLHTRCLADNAEVTGEVYAASLDSMAGGIQNQTVLIIGAGPVGMAAAKWLASKGAQVTVYDCNPEISKRLKKQTNSLWRSTIQFVDRLEHCHLKYPNILEATPSKNTITDAMICDQTRVAAPGVPLGISKTGIGLLQKRLVHDKLELGVAAMAVKLLIQGE